MAASLVGWVLGSVGLLGGEGQGGGEEERGGMSGGG